MTHHPDGRWEIDLDSLRMKMPRLLDPDDEWATGVATILPELHTEYGVKQTDGGSLNIGGLNFNKLSNVTSQVATTVSFCVYKDEFMEQKARRIFLSHKGTDKQEHAVPILDLLELLGFEPWLDTKDMPAGTELHRGIREGFSDSCAAVFLSHLRSQMKSTSNRKSITRLKRRPIKATDSPSSLLCMPIRIVKRRRFRFS